MKKAKTIPPIPQKIWQDPLYFVAFGFGSGAIPVAPGTFGTLMAIPFYLLLQPLPVWGYVLLVLIFSLLSMWVCEKVSRDLNIHDHPGMCIDEFAGFFITMINSPSGWPWLALGFFLFRFFDIAKPWPISFIDKQVHGGFGMVLDDILAGSFSMIIIQIINIL